VEYWELVEKLGKVGGWEELMVDGRSCGSGMGFRVMVNQRVFWGNDEKE